jgi:hypothetical protein
MTALERNKVPKHVRRVAASHVFTPCSAYRDPLFDRLLRYVCKAYGVPTDMKSLRRSSNLRVVGPVPQVSCMLTRHSGLTYWLARFLFPRFHASGICSRMAIVCDKGGARQFMRSPKALLQLAEVNAVLVTSYDRNPLPRAAETDWPDRSYGIADRRPRCYCVQILQPGTNQRICLSVPTLVPT